LSGFFHPHVEEAIAQGRSYSKWGGFLDGFADFDPLFFNISPREAVTMDPQERIFLQACWELLEDAGYTPECVAVQHRGKVGVFAGVTRAGFNLYGPQLWKPGEQAYPYNSFSSVANRVSYFLNLNGPSMPIDTMCSSSLTAIHEACEHLRRNACEMAIAGGVNLYLHPTSYLNLCAQRMLSRDGQCRSFGRGANGFVPGEGVGVVLLKRLSKAVKDEDNIYALIRGTSVNHGGKTNGYTVPSPKAQGDLVREALDNAGIHARAVSYIEAHGTGTELGDPIEIRGLTQAFEKDTRDTGFCAIGSAKSNLGHLEAAAGIAGVAKVLLQMKHRKLVPTLHARELNENIDFSRTPFVVNQSLRDWPNPIIDGKVYPRIAGISSFGAGGSNAHVVIEEYSHEQKEETIVAVSSNPIIVVLSAKNPERLKEHAEQLLQFIRSQEMPSPGIDLRNLAYTLQVGREAMEERLGLIVYSMHELKERLEDFVQDGKNHESVYRGQVRGNKQDLALFTADEELQEAISKWIERGKFTKLLDLWTKGLTFDWNELYGNRKPRRISLPTYPFARERYWVDSEAALPHLKSVVERAGAQEVNRRGTSPRVNEAWVPVAIPGDLGWKDRLRQFEGKSICVLCSDKKDKEGLVELIRQLEHAAGVSRALQIQSLDLGSLNGDLLIEVPEVILFLGPPLSSNGAARALDKAVESVLYVTRAVTARARGKAINVYCLYETRSSQSGEDGAGYSSLVHSAIAHDGGCTWRWIECRNGEIPASRHQLLLREWLADEPAQRNSRALDEVRYAGSERLIRRGPPTRSTTVYLLEKNWKLKDVAGETRPIEGCVLILVNDESIEIGRELLQRLKSAQAILVGDVHLKSAQVKYSIDYKDAAAGRDDFKPILEQVIEQTCIIDLSDLYDEPPETSDDPIGKIAFYQVILAAVRDLKILYFTKHLQAFQSTQMSLAGAKFAGLVKMLSCEYPNVGAKFIDIDQACYDDWNLFEQIINREVHSSLEETELCFRQGKRFAPYIEAKDIGGLDEEGIAGGSTFPVSKDGVYVISGGTNGIGLEIGKYLVSRGVQKLVLMGNTVLPPRSEWAAVVRDNVSSHYVKEKLIRLIQIDKEIPNLEIYTGPLDDANSIRLFFDRIRAQVGEIRGVVHSAGMYSDTETPAFFAKDVGYMRSVFTPKIAGLEVLADIFKDDRLDFFVSFSSLTGVIPRFAKGVSDYALANAFLDFFAAYQFHQKGKKYFKTITWVDWNEAGAASRASAERRRSLEDLLNREGLLTFSSREGYRLFEKCMALRDRSWVLPSLLDEQRFKEAREDLLSVKSKSMLHEVGNQRSLGDRTEDHIAQWEHRQKLGHPVSSAAIKSLLSIEDINQLDPSVLDRLYRLVCRTDDTKASVADSTQASQECLTNGSTTRIIRELLADILKLTDVDDNQTFQNYGLDSITAMMLTTRLERALRREVPARLLVDFQTVQELSDYLVTTR
jgi:polyketide synthase PksN